MLCLAIGSLCPWLLIERRGHEVGRVRLELKGAGKAAGILLNLGHMVSAFILRNSTNIRGFKKNGICCWELSRNLGKGCKAIGTETVAV